MKFGHFEIGNVHVVQVAMGVFLPSDTILFGLSLILRVIW